MERQENNYHHVYIVFKQVDDMCGSCEVCYVLTDEEEAKKRVELLYNKEKSYEHYEESEAPQYYYEMFILNQIM